LKLSKILEAIEALVPLEYAATWDNVGLLYGNPEKDIKHITLCLDITSKALDFALSKGSQLCISHHPLLFDPINRFDQKDPHTRIITRLIQEDMAFYASHTNLDAALGGVSDCLLSALGLKKDTSESQDIFFPVEIKEQVKNFDSLKYGRVTFDYDRLTLSSLYEKILSSLDSPGLLMNFDQDGLAGKIYVAGGSFDSDWIEDIIPMKVRTVITGEMKYHHMLYLAEHGINVFVLGHDVSERVVLDPFASLLRKVLPSISIDVYKGLDYNKFVS